MKAKAACLIAIVLLICLLGMMPAAPEPVAATYTRGGLSLAIPFDAPRAGSGHLILELLDPEDHVLGRIDHALDAAKGRNLWQQELRPDKPIAYDDIVWERVRYHFVYTGDNVPALDETRSVSEILRRPVVHILGQKSYLTGGEASMRIIVTDTNNNPIAGRGNIRVELLQPDHAARVLFTGRVNARGTLQPQFRFPEGLTGNFQLRYVADTAIGSAEYSEPVQLEDKSQILLTTEKPIYQPGQTIHVRALALNRADHLAVGDRKLTFELEDSRGNKVFKRATATDKFGIGSTDFGLADEVNLGTYHLRAILSTMQGDGEAHTNTAELALNVQRYVLPKFKVAVDFDEKDKKQKRDYRPGDHITGTVRSNYFFGKPVDDSEVTLKAESMDVAIFDAATASGKTDKDGNFHFDLKLPAYFAGRPLSQGAARVLVEATVKDNAGHSETRGEPVTVSESSLLITAIPEGGSLIPNLDNQVFLLTSYPDGTPASAALTVHLAGLPDQQVTSDAGGVALAHVKTSDPNSIILGGFHAIESMKIEADDHRGNRAATTVPLNWREGADQILLRANRAVYKAGERIDLSVFSTRSHGAAYLDIVKDGQTIATRDLDLDNGHAELTLTATPQMAGTLDFNAYLFGHDATPVADHRLVFVQPADELHIETVADATEYKPGGEARVRFRVTNSHGQGVSAALGLQVVDEAVFALAEKQPGFAKVFFYLEQEVMKPRYEIHSLAMSDVVDPIDSVELAGGQDKSRQDQRDRDARALFAAAEMTNANTRNAEFGRTLPETQRNAFANRYQNAFSHQVQTLATKLNAVYKRDPASNDLTKVFDRMDDSAKPRDAWGTPVRLERTRWNQGNQRYYLARSAGSDRQFNNGDDMIAYVEVHSAALSKQSNAGRPDRIDLNIEHDRGPAGRFAQIDGVVKDASGAIVPGATVTVRLVSSVDAHTLHSDRQGMFTLAAMQPGRYEVEVTAPGFNNAAQEFDVQARDRAVLNVKLNVGSATQTVEVEATNAAPIVLGMAGGAGMNGRIHGAAMGMEARAVNINGAQDMAFLAQGAAMPMAAPAAKALPLAPSPKPTSSTKDEGEAPAHVRSYFPEALYINPEIITDGNGVASITIPVADSITTWRMAMLASTQAGALGTGTSSLKVFQDFFVDLDLPVTLTQGDRVSIPVAVYNYAGERGDVSLKLEAADWFTLVNDDAQKSLAVDAGRVGAAQFTVQANRIGKYMLTLSAQMKGANRRADIVVREIEVIPNGREQNVVMNGRLDSDIRHDIAFPTNAIPDASTVFVRLYPGPLSQVIEGMDGILRMPGGCFEQTSSSTYPNVLALDYMKRTKKLTPEVHAKAEGYIANGYQRLLTFEVPGGGFSWFGQAPANKILTAYGLMEFSDMAKVYDVDPKLVARTRDWIAQQQQPDGSWKPDTQFINEGATNRFNTDVLRITAYLAWSLEDSGYQGPAVDKAKRYIEQHMGAKADAYTLAVIANFAVEYGHDREFTKNAMQLLLDARTEKDEQASWSADETGVYSSGTSAAIETTGLAAQALLKWGQASGAVRKAMNFITAKKSAGGNWGTTQATIMALRALLLAAQVGTSDVRGTVEVSLNGKVMEKLTLTPENNDLLHQFVFKGIDAKAANNVQLRFDGTGGLAYQVVGRAFTPWQDATTKEALSIDVAYDRTKLAQNDIATETATIRNNLDKTAKMVMVDLGIPPGFDLLSEDLQALVEKSATARGGGRLEKFSLTGTQAILYFDALTPRQTLAIKFRLRAKYPIRAKTFKSSVYEYYNPDVNAVARPVQLEVAAK